MLNLKEYKKEELTELIHSRIPKWLKKRMIKECKKEKVTESFIIRVALEYLFESTDKKDEK